MNLTPDSARIAHEIGNELPNGNRATAFATMYRFNNLTIQQSLSNRFNCQRTHAFPLSAFGGEGWGEVAFIDLTLWPSTDHPQPSTLTKQATIAQLFNFNFERDFVPCDGGPPLFRSAAVPSRSALDDHGVFGIFFTQTTIGASFFLSCVCATPSAAPPAFWIEQMGIKVHLLSELSEYGKRFPQANDHPLLSMRKSLRSAPPERRPARISMSRLRQSRDFRSGRLETARNAHYQKMTRKRGRRS
jgi:hypothetical protein